MSCLYTPWPSVPHQLSFRPCLGTGSTSSPLCMSFPLFLGIQHNPVSHGGLYAKYCPRHKGTEYLYHIFISLWLIEFVGMSLPCISLQLFLLCCKYDCYMYCILNKIITLHRFCCKLFDSLIDCCNWVLWRYKRLNEVANNVIILLVGCSFLDSQQNWYKYSYAKIKTMVS